jgi:hypothetical protein
MRLRFIPTIKAGNARARYWQDELPRLILAMQQIDALPVENMGGGIPWANTVDLPTVELGSGLPIDEMEQATIAQMLRASGLESVEAGVKRLHPDWTEEQIGDEVDRLADEAGQPVAFPGSMLQA